MLEVNQLIGFGAGGGAPAATYVTRVANTANDSSYTFTGASIGDAAGDREVIVVAHLGNINDATPTCTIGGSSATRDAGVGVLNQSVAIFRLAVPSGTTANIVVTTSSGSASRCVVDILRLIGRTFTGGSDTGSNANGDVTLSLSVPPSGVVIAGVQGLGTNDFTWTGATEVADASSEGTTQHACAIGTAGNPAVTSTNGNTAMVAVSYG